MEYNIQYIQTESQLENNSDKRIDKLNLGGTIIELQILN